MRKYLMTGATGHIGNNLLRYILEKEPGADITVLLRSETDLFKGLAIKEKIIDFDCDTAITPLIDCDTVLIHLAAMIDLTDKKTAEMDKINFLLTKRLSDLCLANNAAFIYCGSVDGIYKDGEGIIAEPEDYFPEKVSGGYGKSKAKAQKYLLEKCKADPEFKCTVIMPSAVMGINDYKPSEIGGIIRGCIKGMPEFGLRGGYNFVNVRDVCRAMYQAIVLEKRGQYIVSGENVTVRELYELINKAIGKKKRPIIIPDFLVNLAMPFVGVLNPITVKSLREPHLYSCDKAVREIDYKITPIEQTVMETVQWFNNIE